MKKLVIAIAVLFLSLTVAQAQPYRAAFGLEGGYPGNVGVTYKQFTGPSNFFDYKANLYLSSNVLSLYVSDTFDWNVPITGGLQFFYGLGAGVGATFAQKTYLLACAFGNLGLEYAFSKIPFAISIDYNPGLYMSFYSGFNAGFGYTDANLGIKYTF
ncbi:MAG: hypothetical protein J5639_01230 [Bacteroidales bacterium]|nr:hypothetical protein [Bacteroidales bacterium]